MGNTYQKSSGSAGSKGVDFQIDLLSMFLLNALRQNLRDWRLSTENKLARKFDDVVLELCNGSAILLQAKYKDNKKITLGQLLSTNSKNEDFSLPKYFCSYLDVRTNFPVKFIIICTNTRADAKILKFINQKSVCPASMLHYEDGASFFTFSDDIVADLITKSKVYYKNNLRGKSVDEAMINEENAKEFLKRLQFFLDYPSGNDLEAATEKLLTGLKTSGNLLRNISHRDLHLKVKEWFEQPKGEYLTESRAKAMFCEIKSDKYREWLEEYKVFFKTNDLKLTHWKKRIFHTVPEGDGYLLHLMKVYRTLQNNGTKVLYAVPDDGAEVQELMIKTFELPAYTYLIIVSPKFTEEVINEIFHKMKSILHCRDYKTVIFVAEKSNKLAQRMKSTGDDYDILNIPVTLEDLSEDTQEVLLTKNGVIFQGDEASLKELLPEQISEVHKKSVTSEILQKLIQGEKITVGVGVTDLNDEVSRYYIDRKFERLTKEVWGDYTRTVQREETFSEEDIYDVEEKTILISDSAGTGKTTVLTNLATKIKKNNPRLWVVRVELNECSRMLKNTLKYGRSINVRDLLNCKDVAKMTNELETFLFSLEGMVVLMFDGVDEISPDYTELISDLLIQSQKAENVVKVFVTTRPHMARELERQLNVTSFTLTSLTERNTIDFLTRYWTYNLKRESGSHHKCEEYATKLISKISFLMFDYDDAKKNQFITFPLYVRMLAEVFLENQGSEEWEGCREYLCADEEEPRLPERMNIAELYGMFIEKKRDIFMDKGNPSGNTTANQALMDQFEECLDNHRSLALKIILDKVTCELFPRYSHDIKDKEVKILKMGIVQKLNDRLCFVHRTFAEYFVAEVLLKELQLQNRDARFQRFLINEVFSNPQFGVMRHFLDNLLRTVVPSLPSDIFKSYKSYFGFNDPILIHRLAKGGYTEIIRLLLKCLNYEASKRSENILEELLQRDGIDIRDDNNLTPLHRALVGGHLDTIKFLVEMGADVNSDSEVIGTTLHLAVSGGRLSIIEFLLKSGADINIADSQGRTALHFAVKNSRQDLLELLVRHGADVNIADGQGCTALHLAARAEIGDMFEYLLDHGANINVVDKRGRTPLHFAAESHFCREIFEFVLEHQVDVNAVDKQGNTALHYATNKWSCEIAEFLVDRGADINVTNENFNTALHFAVWSGSFKVVEVLLERGADVNMGDNRGCTALHFAAESEDRDALRIIEVLLKHGADINMVDVRGSTALHFACKSGNPNISEFLIERGADINVATKEGHTALHTALACGRWDIVEILVKHKVNIDFPTLGDDSGIVEFLVKHGVNVNFSKRGDRTTLYLAVSDGRWDIVESLAEYGVNINIEDEQGRTALHFAARNGSCETIAFLLEQGVGVDCVDEEGCTALHLALLSGRWDIVECLVKHGANVNATDKRSRTALHYAVESDNCEIVLFLMEHGVDINLADKEGTTALHLATLSGKKNIAEFLLEHGVDIGSGVEKSHDGTAN